MFYLRIALDTESMFILFMIINNVMSQFFFLLQLYFTLDLKYLEKIFKRWKFNECLRGNYENHQNKYQMKWTRDNVNESLIIRDFALGREFEAFNEQVLYCFVITIAPTRLVLQMIISNKFLRINEINFTRGKVL